MTCSRAALSGASRSKSNRCGARATARGFTLRPDATLMGVLSGLEMACWDIIGKAVDQPVYKLLGGRCTSACAATPTCIRPRARVTISIYDAERSAARAAEYVAQGFTGLKFDPTGGFSAYDPRQPTPGGPRAHGPAGAPDSRGRRLKADLLWEHTANSPPPEPSASAGSSKPTIRSGSRSRCRPRCPSRWPSWRAAPAFRSRPASG